MYMIQNNEVYMSVLLYPYNKNCQEKSLYFIGSGYFAGTGKIENMLFCQI